MKALIIVCIALAAGIAVSFFFYTKLTDSVIKDQERQIAKLKRENAYLAKNRKVVKVENITLNGENSNIPSFKEW